MEPTPVSSPLKNSPMYLMGQLLFKLELLKDLYKNLDTEKQIKQFNEYTTLNKKLETLLIDQTKVKLHPNFQQIPHSQQNGGKKKPKRKVK